MDWTSITRDDYLHALNVLPPAADRRWGFLLGEPHDHDAAGVPRFRAFRETSEGFFKSAEPMTIAEFYRTAL